MPDTILIDNRDGQTLAKALEVVLTGSGVWANPLPNELDIATAFFSPSGFSRIAPHVERLQRIRLMLGAEPPAEYAVGRRRLDETREAWSARRDRKSTRLNSSHPSIS